MKKKFSTTIASILLVLGVCMMTSFSAILISLSQIPVNSKYSFVILILFGGGALGGLLLYELGLAGNKELKAEYERQLKTAAELSEEKLKKVDENTQAALLAAKKENEELKKKLEAMPMINKANLGLGNGELLEKCSFLEKFRDSFPMQVADGYFLYNMIRKEYVPGAYSRWLFVGESDNQLWALEVLRPDVQTYKEMLQLASATKKPQEIQNLNMPKTALWM